MSVQTFHYVQTQLENCYDMLSSDKKKMLLWSRRMHLALKAYKVKIFVSGEGEHNVNRILRCTIIMYFIFILLLLAVSYTMCVLARFLVKNKEN
jgi:hypothetical protein